LNVFLTMATYYHIAIVLADRLHISDHSRATVTHCLAY